MPQQPPPAEEPIGPRVSAILVVYNQAAELRRALEALERSKERERLEVLVVDCGSHDESAQLDAEFPGINMLRLPHHFGATKAMNIAIRTAKSELIFLLSPDVEVQPDTIPRLAAKLEEDENLAAACPLLTGPEGEPASKVFRIPTRETLGEWVQGSEPEPAPLDLSEESIVVEYPGRDALLVRKQVIRGINYFDQRYGEYWADADLAMQIRRGGKKIRLYPEIRAILHPSANPLAGDALVISDKTLGAAAFLA
ncbi:MAG TPA: glycosyltransferase, partial [Bryobacteraceae bacterium]|nr:glycosyltransferase [Bryobacteraceae bacterium]